jgi:hypothetical protein
MLHADVPVDRLLSTETWVFASGVADAEAALLAGKAFEAPVVPYPDASGPDYILLDRHHQAVAAHRLGRLTVPGLICVTTRDLESDPLLNRMMLHWDLDTIDELRAAYRDEWAPEMSARTGVARIADLAATDFR